MSVATNLFRRGAVYYFRRRLRWPDGGGFGICLSLRTRRVATARQRAAMLAASCERLWARLAMRADHGLTHDQRREVFCRQLALERDKLDALHCAVLGLPGGDVWPQRQSDELPGQLETMERICHEWIVYGCPSPGQFSDLETYLGTGLDLPLDELDRIYLLGGLGSLEILTQMLDCGAVSALHGVGAPVTAANAGRR